MLQQDCSLQQIMDSRALALLSTKHPEELGGNAARYSRPMEASRFQGDTTTNVCSARGAQDLRLGIAGGETSLP